MILNMTFISCSDEIPEPDPEENATKERLILIYAIAANSLQPNLTDDMNEILRVAPYLNLKNNKVLVYSVKRDGICRLQELRKTPSGGFGFETVQEFPDLPLSTSPERISDVISYVTDNYEYPYKGLVLWSHATGWIPWFDGDTPEQPSRRAFGEDQYDGQKYMTNITTLAEAIPEDTFDFIWFDCCYMANIETVYQLREKTDKIVGYVMEIADSGMPYDITMPYLLRKDADLRMAAKELFEYYNDYSIAISVSIMDTKYLPELAEASKEVIATGTAPSASRLKLVQDYQRFQKVNFYDMGQLLNSYSELSEDVKANLTSAFSNAVVYKAISNFDFNRIKINVADFSGLSMYNFTDSDNSYDLFYQQLDWYQATR